MNFLATVFVCVACAELSTNIENREVNNDLNLPSSDLHLPSNDLHLPSRALPLLVSNETRCQYPTNCRLIEIIRNASRFDIFTDTGTEEGRICYRRITPNSMVHDGTARNMGTSKQGDHITKAHRGRERLLIVPSCRNIPPKEYNLQTGSLQDYHDKRLVNIKCMVFMPLTQQLLLSTVKPGRVQIYSKYGRKTIRKYFAILLAFDEKRRFIFIVKYKSYNIYRTNFDGTKHRVRVYQNKREKIHDIVANMEAKVIYMACRKGLVVLTYNGRIIGILDKNNKIYCVSLDLQHGVLYYSAIYKLRRVVLSEKKTELVFKYRFTPAEMIYHNGSIFFSIQRKDQIFQMIIGRNPTLKEFIHGYGKMFLLHIAVTSI